MATAAGADENAQQLINQTFSGKKKVDSGKLNMNLTREAEGHRRRRPSSRSPVSLKLTGPFQSRGEDELPEVDLD